MTLSQLHAHLGTLNTITITRPGGETVPAHFHLTELGEVTKAFIDCGGTFRRESKATVQLWYANDYDHRLAPAKFRGIVEMGRDKLGLGDLDVEVEFQLDETLGRYGLEPTPDGFQLTRLQTACLATDACGIPAVALPLSHPKAKASACTPGNGCC